MNDLSNTKHKKSFSLKIPLALQNPLFVAYNTNTMRLITPEMPQYEMLRRPVQEVVFPLTPKIRSVIAEMRQFIENLASPNGKPAGLAAPQVGYDYRIIFFQIPPEAKHIRKDAFDIVPLTVLLNPSYTPISAAGRYKDWEGCYSVEDKMGEVYRYTEIEYQGFLENGEKIKGSARGLLARILQHEVGHLQGELYTDLLCNDCRFGSHADMWPLRQAEIAALREQNR